jgi:hypothetical protein
MTAEHLNTGKNTVYSSSEAKFRKRKVADDINKKNKKIKKKK